MTEPILTTGRSDHVHDLLSGYMNGDLDDAERLAVESHLEECVACRGDLSTLRLTVAALRQMPSTPRPRDFLIAPKSVRRPSAMVHLRIWSGALAAILAIVVGARLLFPSTLSLPLATPAPLVSRASPPLPAAAPPGGQDVATSPVPAARQLSAAPPTQTTASTPKTGGASSAAPSGAAPSRATSTGTTPSTSPNSASAPIPAAPISPEAYPAADSGAASTVSSVPYPAPAALPQAGPTAASYPAPGSTGPSAPVTPSSDNYAAPGAAPVSVPSAATPDTTSTVQTQTPARETTWFTPALGILGALVFGTAIVLWVLGRRSP